MNTNQAMSSKGKWGVSSKYKRHDDKSSFGKKRSLLSPIVKFPRVHDLAFIILALAIALFGGSSRLDINLLLLLRPVSVICLATMLLAHKRVSWNEISPLPLLLLAFGLTIVVQLIPLPPALWTAIPKREQYDAVSKALNGLNQWHSLSLSPDRTWNSLIALLVPCATIVGYVGLNVSQRRALLTPILGLVACSMLLGLAQFAEGKNSFLYWYEVSGKGQLIGLLANRNHQSALLALSLPLLRAWTLQDAANGNARKLRNIIGLCLAAVIVVYVLILGSRAGLALTFLGLLGAFLIEPRLHSNRKISQRQRNLSLAAIAFGVLALLAAAWNADRALSIVRLAQSEELTNVQDRIRAIPTLFHLMAQSFPFGTGFGSFVPVYASVEPDNLLKPTYFNNAHNDLIELVITGGSPAALVFIVFMLWWFRVARKSFSQVSVPSYLARAAVFSTLILLLASLVDYPLRTPLLGSLFAIFCCWLASFEHDLDVNRHKHSV